MLKCGETETVNRDRGNLEGGLIVEKREVATLRIQIPSWTDHPRTMAMTRHKLQLISVVI